MARKAAMQTGTAIVVVRNKKIVRLTTDDLREKDVT